MCVSRYACRPIFILAATSKKPVEKDQAVTVHDLEGLVLKAESTAAPNTGDAQLRT